MFFMWSHLYIVQACWANANKIFCKYTFYSQSVDIINILFWKEHISLVLNKMTSPITIMFHFPKNLVVYGFVHCIIVACAGIFESIHRMYTFRAVGTRVTGVLFPPPSIRKFARICRKIVSFKKPLITQSYTSQVL